MVAIIEKTRLNKGFLDNARIRLYLPTAVGRGPALAVVGRPARRSALWYGDQKADSAKCNLVQAANMSSKLAGVI